MVLGSVPVVGGVGGGGFDGLLERGGAGLGGGQLGQLGERLTQSAAGHRHDLGGVGDSRGEHLDALGDGLDLVVEAGGGPRRGAVEDAAAVEVDVDLGGLLAQD